MPKVVLTGGTGRFLPIYLNKHIPFLFFLFPPYRDFPRQICSVYIGTWITGAYSLNRFFMRVAVQVIHTGRDDCCLWMHELQKVI